MDRAPRQVMLEARMVVIENTNFSDLGVQWTFPTISAGAFSDSFQHEKGAVGGSWPWGLQIGYTPSKTFTNSLLLTLNLLAQNNDATVMANPQVVAIEGKESQLSVTSEEYFQILTQGFYTNSQLEKIDSGTMLRITPHVGNDGKIMLEMRAEVSDVVSRGAANLPVVSRRTAQSTVGVEDGGTAVVAGLLDNRTRDEQDRVPFLGRIPLIGRLFRNDALTNTQRQVAMFVTARLVPKDDSLVKQPEPPERIAPVDAVAFRSELTRCLYSSDGVPGTWQAPAAPFKGAKAPWEEVK
jgi:type II secretory pathway component GspD/PulD (secretin)